ncbi:monocyte differentiation antigen CD14 [Sceloporus undulatus]|uniref:monocyte differentiation antigen CD14 n=1 Tax=Sceloporus undulatus TaxID=8520 RepID=UPI001C4C60BF|nr:monocyte differentiation antigen CD14 [Sceloporus undulatus]
MHATWAVVFFLLFGFNLPKAKGNCYLEKSQEHCVCSLLERINIQTLLHCLQATTYELRGGNLKQFAVFSIIHTSPELIQYILGGVKVCKLIFTNLIVPEVLLPTAMQFAASFPQVSELEFINCTFVKSADQLDTDGFDLKVSSLHFHKVMAAPLDDRVDISSLRSWLETLENLSVTESEVTSIPCKISTVLRALRFLDLSGNRFQDQGIEKSFCKGAFPQLQVLKLHGNNLTSYETVCQTLAHLNQLTHLDLSQNDFVPELVSSPCLWPPSLRVFNLSSTGFEHIDRSLPPDIEILDLSANHIFTLDLSIPGLKELYLSHNRLPSIPSVKGLPSLEVLSLDHNQLSQLPTEGLLHLKNLHSLKAGHNLYNCSCRQTIKEIQDLATSKALLPDWPHDYICSSPLDYQDYVLNEVPLSSLQCSRAAMLRQGSGATLLTYLPLVLSLLSLPAYRTQPIVL